MGRFLGYRNLAARFRDSFLDAILDLHFSDIHDRGEFRDEQKPSPIEHPLFAEREWLNPTEIYKILKDFGDMENRSGTHFFGVFLEAVFPIFLCEKLITAEEC